MSNDRIANSFAKPLPVPTPATAPYWDAAREHQLIAPRCNACGKLFFHPQAQCPHCISDDIGWETMSGRGTVYSCTVVRQPGHPGFQGDVPYVFAIIELEEGIRMSSNVVGCAPEDVQPDQKVEVVFEEASPEITLPKFRLA